jgi:hypothetical protein
VTFGVLPLLVVLASHEPGYEPPDSCVEIDASSSCVTALSTSPLFSPSAIQLVPDATVPPGMVAAAEAAWNSSSCNTNGTAFPVFTTAAISGSRSVPVNYVNGINPNNSFTCGITGVTGITIYSQAKMPNGTTTSCGSGNIQTQNLEHEMGHELDLADSSCLGYIMSQVAFPPQTGPIPPQPLPRAIQPSECAEANTMNITPAEQPPPTPPPAPPNECPPTCSCPATCEYGCNANGICLDSPCDTDPTAPGCDEGGNPGGGACGDQPCDDGVLQSQPPPPPSLLRARPRPQLLVNRRTAPPALRIELSAAPAVPRQATSDRRPVGRARTCLVFPLSHNPKDRGPIPTPLVPILVAL